MTSPVMRETDVKKSTFYRLRSGEGRAPSYERSEPIERLFLSALPCRR